MISTSHHTHPLQSKYMDDALEGKESVQKVIKLIFPDWVTYNYRFIARYSRTANLPISAIKHVQKCASHLEQPQQQVYWMDHVISHNTVVIKKSGPTLGTQQSSNHSMYCCTCLFEEVGGLPRGNISFEA